MHEKISTYQGIHSHISIPELLEHDFVIFQKEICTSNMLYNERVCNTLTDLDIHFVHKQSLADKCALKCKKIIGTNKYV